MPVLELLILAGATFVWAALAFLGDAAEGPVRTRAESSPFAGTDFGVD